MNQKIKRILDTGIDKIIEPRVLLGIEVKIMGNNVNFKGVDLNQIINKFPFDKNPQQIRQKSPRGGEDNLASPSIGLQPLDREIERSSLKRLFAKPTSTSAPITAAGIDMSDTAPRYDSYHTDHISFKLGDKEHTLAIVAENVKRSSFTTQQGLFPAQLMTKQELNKALEYLQAKDPDVFTVARIQEIQKHHDQWSRLPKVKTKFQSQSFAELISAPPTIKENPFKLKLVDVV